jgi:hypothetical protein
MVILSLFDYTGAMVQPWAEAGYTCICVDTQHSEKLPRHISGGNIYKVNYDVYGILRYAHNWPRPDIIFGFPPCTDLAVSGSRWFKQKAAENPNFQHQAVSLCRQVEALGEKFGVRWMAENPVGRLSTLWRKPDHWFHPWQFTALELDDNYTKKTGAWTGNGFAMPDPQVHPMVQNAVDSVAAQFGRFVAKPDVLKTNWVKGHRKFIEKWYPDDRIHKAAPGPDRANFRSATPLGFAKAVFACNG